MEFIWNANDSIEYFKKQIECIFKLKLKIKNHVFRYIIEEENESKSNDSLSYLSTINLDWRVAMFRDIKK